MMDWDGDPALKAMRDEFIDSFAERAAILRARASVSAPDVRHVAHKLAGAAESYDFPTLTRIGAALDDLISQLGVTDLKVIGPYALLLAEAIEESVRTRKDPSRFLADERCKRLISDAGSPASEPSP